ncbi:MAG: WYL domain-containing protein [candidate division NC10 bacterium]|nr:WYL domain-containing protein [candidate division NC10 bacterium]
MPRGDQVIRQWKLLRLLESRRGRTLEELVKELNCCTRTIIPTPSNFDVEAYMRESFGILRGGPAVPVKVKFSNAWARWIGERIWHPSQTLERLPGGELILTLQVAVTDELKRWILSFGREAEVVEPIVLREAVRAEAQALLERLEVEDLAREFSSLQLTLPVIVGV